MYKFVVRLTLLTAVFVFSAALLNAAEKEGSSTTPAKSQGEVQKAVSEQSQSPSKAAMGGIRASQVIGKGVINTKGDKLGHVQDLVLSKGGCVEYMILAHGGLLGIGNKLIPIPWKSVETGTHADVLIVRASKENLEKAPKFATQQWPDFTNPKWKKKIFEFFGIQSGSDTGKNQ